MMKKTMMMNKW